MNRYWTRFSTASLLIAAVASGLSGCMWTHGRDHGTHRAKAAAQAACPVCGRELKVGERTPRASRAGRLYYFDGEEHLREFIMNPGHYPDGGRR